MRAAAALAALLATTAPALAQDARTAFDGRSLARALDDRCGLYNAPERAALDAAWLQARGILIRGGADPHDLTARAAGFARRAQPMPCDSADAQSIALDVAAAFENWLRVREMDFPGSERVWLAARPYPGYPAWTLSQYPVPGDPAHIFGFFHEDGERELAFGLPAAPGLSTARLVMRDITREAELTDPSLGGLLRVSGRPDWVRHAPPAHAEATVWASDRIDAGDQMRFVFPERTIGALSGLDPRETVRIEALDTRGRVAGTWFIEIGDFAAGTAFLAAGDTLPSGGTGG
ncbi:MULTISPECIES: hypothetical protein [Hyphobacterium]|uniref:SCP domain-containing protein n=1 Tax=Hyphobacterium vulgare TaxID=1736751 RepID=A0ABV6ZUW1_9PROT